MRTSPILALGLTFCLPACSTSQSLRADSPSDSGALCASLELPVARAPFDHVEVSWKERIDQPYVFLELHGSYGQTGHAFGELRERIAALGIEPSGPPFALFYDDPGHVAASELRSRACVPVEADHESRGPLGFDVLPSATVAYAFVGGAYPEVPRAYPPLFAYVEHMGWATVGPIREIYLVPPGSVRDWSELVCEVQIPAAPAR
jgi:effector-binding domain-containing protein